LSEVLTLTIVVEMKELEDQSTIIDKASASIPSGDSTGATSSASTQTLLLDYNSEDMSNGILSLSSLLDDTTDNSEEHGHESDTNVSRAMVDLAKEKSVEKYPDVANESTETGQTLSFCNGAVELPEDVAPHPGVHPVPHNCPWGISGQQELVFGNPQATAVE
jgi:hypothetical protein